MINQLTPNYLSSLVPHPVGAASRYNLRDSNSLQTIDARTNQYLQLLEHGIDYQTKSKTVTPLTLSNIT